MILEGIVTSLNTAGSLNIAPMGPVVETDNNKTLLLRPFQSSTTFQNLSQQRCGVFHVVDNVLLVARAAINVWESSPETFAASQIKGDVLKDSCRWLEFEVDQIDTSHQRSEMIVRVVHTERLRDFFGLNRAKHLVLEAIILATRVHLLSQEEIETALKMYRTPIEKTAGENEQLAFSLIESYLQAYWSKRENGVET